MDETTPGVKHPLAWAIGGLVVVVVLVTVIAFEPWTVVTEGDEREPFPNELSTEAQDALLEAAETDRTGSDPAPSPEAAEKARGPFEGRSGRTVDGGEAVLLEAPDGPRWVRLEGLDVDNGPNLHVYLSASAADAPSAEFGETFVDLGELKFNEGDSNYEVPPEVDLSAYRSVVIWCEQFGVNFAVSPLRVG
jgi:hypothetical protein